ELLLNPLPTVMGNNPQRLRQLQRQPVAFRTLTNAALGAFAVAWARRRIARLAALELVVVPDPGVGLAVQNAEHARLRPLRSALLRGNLPLVEAVPYAPRG